MNQASAGRRRPRPPGILLCPRSLLTNHECHGLQFGCPRQLRRWERRASKIQDGKDVGVLRSPVAAPAMS